MRDLHHNLEATVAIEPQTTTSPSTAGHAGAAHVNRCRNSDADIPNTTLALWVASRAAGAAADDAAAGGMPAYRSPACTLSPGRTFQLSSTNPAHSCVRNATLCCPKLCVYDRKQKSCTAAAIEGHPPFGYARTLNV